MSEPHGSSSHAHDNEPSDETTGLALLVAAASLGAFVLLGNTDSKAIDVTEAVKHNAAAAPAAHTSEAAEKTGDETAPSVAVDDLAVEEHEPAAEPPPAADPAPEAAVQAPAGVVLEEDAEPAVPPRAPVVNEVAPRPMPMPVPVRPAPQAPAPAVPPGVPVAGPVRVPAPPTPAARPPGAVPPAPAPAPAPVAPPAAAPAPAAPPAAPAPPAPAAPPAQP